MTVRRAYTGFPQVGTLPHLAPVFGAMPIPGVSRMPTAMQEPAVTDQIPTMTPDAVLDATGRSAPLATAPGAGTPLPEVMLGIGTASLSGAITGGIAASSWRGAGIGAGVNAGLWSSFTLLGGWNTLSTGSRAALGLTAAGGLIGAAVLAFMRKGK